MTEESTELQGGVTNTQLETYTPLETPTNENLKGNYKEIVWNVVNSALAGFLVCLGGLSTGNFDTNTLILALGAGAVAAAIQFQKYWASEQPEYCNSKTLFSWI